MTRILLAIAAATMMSIDVAAQASEPERPVVPLQDNSFLLEEAYNQEADVVQHIFILQRGEHDAMNASLSQEWPIGGMTHQFSYQVPIVRVNGASGAGLGDLVLNYRLQALGGGDARVSVSPRISLNLPTGRGARGRGSYGFGLGFPISYLASPTIVTHTNLGVLHVPGAREADGRTGNAEYTIGQSVIYKAHPQMHLMMETVWMGGDADSFVISPGVRFAMNFKSGLQIVPGIAFPIETRPDSKSVLFYLSFEHPFAQARTGDRNSGSIR